MKKFQLRTIFISHNAIVSHEQGRRSNGFSIGNANDIAVVHLTQRLCLSHVKVKTNEASVNLGSRELYKTKFKVGFFYKCKTGLLYKSYINYHITE